MIALSFRVRTHKAGQWEGQEAMQHVLVLGVCGVGKSTVAQALAEAMGARFVEADEFHSPENIARMASGQPLTDEMRTGWLEAVAEAAADGDGPAVVACSALKERYRRRLSDRLGPLTIIHLTGDRALLVDRMGRRQGHFMPASLIDSQFADLETPEGDNVITIDVQLPPDEVVDRALNFIRG